MAALPSVAHNSLLIIPYKLIAFFDALSEFLTIPKRTHNRSRCFFNKKFIWREFCCGVYGGVTGRNVVMLTDRGGPPKAEVFLRPAVQGEAAIFNDRQSSKPSKQKTALLRFRG